MMQDFKLVVAEGHVMETLQPGRDARVFICTTCGVSYGWHAGAEGLHTVYWATLRLSRREAHTKRDLIRLLLELKHAALVEVAEQEPLDPILQVRRDIAWAWIEDTQRRPGLKRGGGEKEKGKGTPKHKLGKRWWELEDPAVMERDNQVALEEQRRQKEQDQ